MAKRIIAALAAAVLLSVSCSSSTDRAAHTRTNCGTSLGPINDLKLPRDLKETAEQILPIEMPGAAELSMSMFEFESLEEPTGDLAVFVFHSLEAGPLIPQRAVAEPVEGTTGPLGIMGVNILEGDSLIAALMSRSIPTDNLIRIASDATVESDGTIMFPGHTAKLVSLLQPSDIPGLGSVAVSGARSGTIESYTNNHSRHPDDDQRAVVIARFCKEVKDIGRAEAMSWWYGVPVEIIEHNERPIYHLFYDAPAGNGITRTQFWEDETSVTMVTTYGLTVAENDQVVVEIADKTVTK
ncbi:MAG: hypothetical protein WC184_01380 [Acidimicrobiia bacterium]